jgi:hypothetical protein
LSREISPSFLGLGLRQVPLHQGWPTFQYIRSIFILKVCRDRLVVTSDRIVVINIESNIFLNIKKKLTNCSNYLIIKLRDIITIIHITLGNSQTGIFKSHIDILVQIYKKNVKVTTYLSRFTILISQFK